MANRGSAIVTCVVVGLLGACGRSGSLPAATPADGGGPGAGLTTNGDSGVAASGALPCEVERVLVTRCQSCHQRPPIYGAPMPLLTFADAMATAPAAGTAVWRAMRAKVAAGLMPPAGSPGGALTDVEKATLMGWLDAGAPADPRTAACSAASMPPAPAAGPEALPCTPKYEFRAEGSAAGQPFPVPPGVETYRCFSTRVPFAAGEQAVAWAPVIDDKRVVHHYILYAHKNADVPLPDCADKGRVFVLGWAPGGGNGVMPADVGLELPDPGTWVTLEVHYNNRAGYTDARDRSGVALCTTDKPRAQEAGVVTLGTVGIAIPAAADDYAVTSEIPGVLTRVLPQPLHVLWTSPHMHVSGKSFKTELVRGGATLPLVDVPAWEFGNQRAYPRDPATTLIMPGDDVRTTCTYKNPTTSIIRFGERTENEMCFNFLVVYPIAGVPLREWVTQ